MLTILLLDDDVANLNVFAAILWAEGYKVLEAASGKEALDVSHRRSIPIDLLVSDVGLGDDLSGTDVANNLVDENVGLPVLFISGTPFAAWSDRDRMNFRQLSPQSTDFLEKPFSLTDFLEAIERLIRRHTRRLSNVVRPT